jgi:glycosyltransferase involved in cell wall biosynthesis
MKNLKILYIADGRSPTALNWIQYFIDAGLEIHLVSTFPCWTDILVNSLQVIPIPFSGAGMITQSDENSDDSLIKSMVRKSASVKLKTWIRHRFIPFGLPKTADGLDSIIKKIKPDIVHAMRIPFEGMMAAIAFSHLPYPQSKLLISIWGNDFTLHAPATMKMGNLTKKALQVANALHADCKRDLNLAHQWGFNLEKPAVVLPGAGGIQTDIFYPPDNQPDQVVINPRGFRAYIRNDTFFRAIPLILQKFPETKFVCPSMSGHSEAEKWVKTLDIRNAVKLLPRQERSSMADLFRQAQIAVSPSTHDGTPNTLLESMSCGCFPIAGDLESIREWITPGINGLLVDPNSPESLAEAVITGLGNIKLRKEAQKINSQLIRDKAEYRKVMEQAMDFYQSLIQV